MKCRPRLPRWMVVLVLAIGITGCDRRLDTAYCSPRGDSINGVSAFIQILRDAGHRVEVSRFLTQHLADRHSGLILFHDEAGPIDPKNLQKINKVITDSPVGLILLVAKNGDLKEAYFREMVKKLKDFPERHADAQTSLDNDLNEKKIEDEVVFTPQEGKFFGLEEAEPQEPANEKADLGEFRRVEVLRRDDQLPGDTQTVVARWPARRRMVIHPGAETLWKVGDEPLLAEYEQSGTRILVLSAAVPLLNAGLVDEGNRRLCAALLDELEYLPSFAVVTSTSWLDKDPDGGSVISRLLGQQPFPWVLGHLAGAIILFCWWKFPILGRPRDRTETATRQFGRHVDALGQLLRAAKGGPFARERLREWKHSGKKDHSQSEV